MNCSVVMPAEGADSALFRPWIKRSSASKHGSAYTMQEFLLLRWQIGFEKGKTNPLARTIASNTTFSVRCSIMFSTRLVCNANEAVRFVNYRG